MEMLCPECLGPLVTSDGKTARCTLHGGEYRILYLRGQAVVQPLPKHSAFTPISDSLTPESELDAGNPYRSPIQRLQTCVNHPEVRTDRTCEACGEAICPVCAFPQANGSVLCPDCVGTARVHTPDQREVPDGVTCSGHPEVQAVHYCTSCRKPVCPTCDFALPGGVHVCPDCAMNTNRGLSSGRKKLVGWALGLAVWCTVGLALLFTGLFAEVASNPHEAEAFGMVFSLLVFMPALVGVALSLATLDRRLNNPPVVWVAIIWNIVIVAILLLLTLVGMFMS